MIKSILILFLFHGIFSNVWSKNIEQYFTDTRSVTKDSVITILLGKDTKGKQLFFSAVPSKSNYGYDLDVFYLDNENKNVIWAGVGSIDTINYVKNSTIVYYNASGGGFDNSYEIKIAKGKLLVNKIREYGFPTSILKQLKDEDIDFTFSMSDDLRVLSYDALQRVQIDTFHEQTKFYFLLNENNQGLQSQNPDSKLYQYAFGCDAMMLNCKILDKFSPKLNLKFTKNSKSGIPLLFYNKNDKKVILEYRRRKYRVQKD